jgi:RNA polymerase sigma-70 factor (ECF subfamily)
VQSFEKNMLRFPGKSDEFQQADAREDACLLARIAGGDQGALEELFRRRGGLIYSVLARMLSNEMEVEEVTQDTFMRIWQRAHRYEPRLSSPLAWMIMLARGRGIDQLRARSRRRATQTAYEQEVASLEVEINCPRETERDDLGVACALALNDLPEAQGQALQLAFLRGWTHEEISRALGEPLGTIKARIRRGLLSLRKILKDYHG